MSTTLPNPTLPSDDERAFSVLERIVETTTRIFGTSVEVRSAYDPEHPREKVVEFVVHTDADSATIRDMEQRWAKEMREVTRVWKNFSLLIRAV
jgi:hypothetical protein